MVNRLSTKVRVFSSFYLLAVAFNKLQGSDVSVRTYGVSFVYFLPKVIPLFIPRGGVTSLSIVGLLPFLLLKKTLAQVNSGIYITHKLNDRF